MLCYVKKKKLEKEINCLELNLEQNTTILMGKK